MFFTLSKIIWIFISPLTFLCLLIGAGIMMSFFKATKKKSSITIKFAIILLFAFSVLPIGYNLQVFLEHQTVKPRISNTDNYGGIIILGGCMNAGLSHIYKTPMINGSCERILDGIKLHKQFPDLPFIYSGGSGSIRNQRYKGADAAKHLIENLDVDTTGMIFERNSRNTYENMALSHALLNNEQLNKPWLLVTSASHMPRASRVFCQGGWDITPYPTDYQTDGHYRLKFASPLYNFMLLESTLKEIIGITAYGISGKLSLKACHNILK